MIGDAICSSPVPPSAGKVLQQATEWQQVLKLVGLQLLPFDRACKFLDWGRTNVWNDDANAECDRPSRREAGAWLPEKRSKNYAHIYPANGNNLRDAMSNALQAHEESGGKNFTEDDVSDIARLTGTLKHNHTRIRIPLGEEAARSAAWRTSADLNKKLIGLGYFHISRPHLE